MSNPHPIVTWRALGPTVSAGYLALGSYAACFPIEGAKVFGFDTLIPRGLEEDESKTAVKQTYENVLWWAMKVLGARDFSLGISIGWLWWRGGRESMGVVILSGMVLCAADVAMVWYLKGMRDGALMGAGAAIWGVIGWGLLQGQ